MKKLLMPTILMFFLNISFGAYLTNMPVTITQPNGEEIECFATGDEYYNWVHDANNYTIVQDTITGYYCYAIINNGNLVASPFIVGVDKPAINGLTPGVNISEQQIQLRSASVYETMHPEGIENIPFRSEYTSMSQTLNNIVIYIRFADQTEFPENQAIYTGWFNTNTTSMRNYFLEASYGQLDINSTFYPLNNGTIIISYQDQYAQNYYTPAWGSTHPGYRSDAERTSREHALLYNAIEYVKSQIPTSLNVDSNSDGSVDNICFVIRGGTANWGTLLWPHKWNLSSYTTYINGAKVSNYNFLFEGSGVSTICHEMNHTLGAPDLYHNPNNDRCTPVGPWDLMATDLYPPQHMSAYMKYKYNKWVQDIPTITSSGRYTLNPLASSTNNCYRIQMDNGVWYNKKENIILEYRKKEGVFESSLPGSGLIIYRAINDCTGNIHGTGCAGINGGDEIYVFRPDAHNFSNGRITDAYFSNLSGGRTKFHSGTNPFPYSSNNKRMNVYIDNVEENLQNNTISFDVRFCDGNNITYINTNIFPSKTMALEKIETKEIVIVKNSDNVIFEAGSEVFLNTGFEVQAGGIFEINMKGCGTLY